MIRPERLWPVLTLAALFVLPWYGIEETSVLLHLEPDSMPAVVQMLGRAWLVPLLAAPAIALWGGFTGRPRVLVAAGVVGLLWLTLEGLAINHRGWTWGALAALGTAPVQPALGWGALAYAWCCTMLAAVGLARQGRCRGDIFVVGAILLIGLSLILFIFAPLLSVFSSAVRDQAGHVDLVLFWTKLTHGSIWGLDCITGGAACGSAWNTLFMALLVGITTTALGLAFALVAVRMRVRFRPVLGLLSILPVITPPFVIGLALIILFGRAGIISSFLATNLGIPRSRWLYGLPGVAIAQTLAFTPIAYLVLAGVLQAVSPSMEEAAQTLRAGRWHTFRTVTWPLIRPGIANAFLISFIESMADFANPLMLGGNFTVLATDIFFAVVGAVHDQGRAAVLGIVLLAFTLIPFFLQRFWQEGHSFTSITGKGDSGIHPPLPGPLRALCLATVVPWLVLTAAVYGLIMVYGFMVNFGHDNSFTLQYLFTAFGIEHGVGGWFLSGSAWNSFITTLELAVIAMPLTAGMGLLTAWLLARQSFAGKGAFEFLAMMSFAIPGTVVGIAYILAFNIPPVELTGTATILVIAFVFRNMPVGIRAGLASLSQVDRSLDEASLTLGARSFRTLRLVVLPIIRPAIITALVYAFVRAVTAVSTVIFLTTAVYQLATVYIVGRADVGEYGIALIYSAALIAVMVTCLGLISLVIGRQRIGRRELNADSMGVGVV